MNMPTILRIAESGEFFNLFSKNEIMKKYREV